MKKITVLLAAGLMCAALSAPALAHDESCCDDKECGMHEKMMGPMHGSMGAKLDLDEMVFNKAHMIMENAGELGLSAEQTEKVKMLKMDAEKTVIRSDADMKLVVIDIKDALSKDEVDAAAVGALIDKKIALKAQEEKALVGTYAELKKAITKDQMTKLHEMKKAGGEKRMMTEEREHRMGMRHEM